MRFILLIVMSASLSAHPLAVAQQPQKQSDGKQRDEMGREIIRGPVSGVYFNNVHVISDSVGIRGWSVVVTNSVIEAPVCIRTSGQSSTISNNDLKCDLGIEFTEAALIRNTLTNNRFTGRGTNRPDVLGW
ncbi:hypothetical protein [Burkholderia lata]|uniref:hypothetical protein n=1 Tax=Burkholderia lata (strain ATCC 17760 / DSM 23089 / LMG 22485 / NCIMB 9086 / R18194 / 383) TaxID=482957 RepID=UPI000B0580D3|nr:hypothetical protein [Burkholderia lata]